MTHSLSTTRPFVHLLFLIIASASLAACGGSSSKAAGSSSSSSGGTPSPTLEPEPIYSGLHTWWHEEHELNDSSPVADEKVRRSPTYDVAVATAADVEQSHPSFVYMTIPRSGKSKEGYTYHDGAEFTGSANLTMSWSTFLFDTDAWITVTLKDDHILESVDEVTIRPTTLAFEKELVDEKSVRIRVPYSADGHRFSVEFDHQLMTSYSDQSGASGKLSENPAGAEIHTEPRNSLLIFAEPIVQAEERNRLIPDVTSESIFAPARGHVDLSGVSAEVVYFQPGIYYMSWNSHAYLPENVKWVYLAPGAYVKGAFQFRNAKTDYRVTGYGVLSGEQYVYQADRYNGDGHTPYTARDEARSDCHSSCVKMLEFASSSAAQTLEVNGVTIVEPPYHSFVVYGDEAKFDTDISHYKQVGGWYWQTDGMEIYRNGSLANSFFHANDDVIKIYHSNTETRNIVVWKEENGPVIQFGWASRNIDNVSVSDIDVIHNRMYWKDQKHNTCIINSADLYSDTPMAKDEVSVNELIRNISFNNIRSEGKNLCAMRFLALSNWENIHVNGLEIEEWNGLDKTSQYSLFAAARTKDSEPQAVNITEGNGLIIENYSVEQQPITVANDNWRGDQLGRMAFDEELSASWTATADFDAPCTAQTIDFKLSPAYVPFGATLPLTATASPSGYDVSFSVSAGDAAVENDTATMGNTAGGVSIAAVQEGDATYCAKTVSRGITVYDPATGPEDGRWIGASWAGWTPSNIPMTWNENEQLFKASVSMETGDHALKFTNTEDWQGDDWAGVSGLSGTAIKTTGGGANISFTIDIAGVYLFRFDPFTLEYSITLE